MWRLSLPEIHWAQPLWRHSTVCVCVCVCVLVCLVLVSCSPSLSLSISRMISLTRAPQGSVILVISSTRRSIVAASGRPNNAEKRKEKKIVIAMIHRRALITGAWQDQTGELTINKPMSGVRDLLEHLKWMKRICKKKNTETQKPAIDIYLLYLHQVNLWATEEGLFFFFFPLLISSRGKQSCRAKLTGEALHTGPVD